MNRPTPEPSDGVAPECAAVLQRLQAVLDGELDWTQAAQETIRHRQACLECHERWLAGLLLRTVLERPSGDTLVHNRCNPAAVSAIVAEFRADRRRRRWFMGAASALTAAAAVLLLIFRITLTEPASPPPLAPAANDCARDASAPSFRLQDEIARAAETLRDAVDDWTDTPLWPRADPAASGADVTPPARDDSPWNGLLISVRTGLEPVADTTHKALDRLLKDLQTWQPQPPPKS